MKALCLAALIAPLCAYAESPPAPAADQSAPVADSVIVKGVRDPAIMPYADAYAFQTQVQRVQHDKVRMRLQVKSNDKAVSPADIRIRLTGENTDIPVPLGPEGDVEIPLSAEALADKAEFVTNQKRSSLAVHLTLSPRLADDGKIAYADALEATEQSKRLMKEIIPWYFRLLIPNPNALRFCFEREGAQAALQTRSGQQALEIKGKRQCAVVPLDADAREDTQAILLSAPYKAEFTRTGWFSDGHEAP
ncbi:hypothetical protein OPU71_04590 [Niveibacterium sp. 24ML]|uniref:hypothetical protein n=1 Tax=Niveibacterium sp. 24ML TaxID=2985512 RepID=UPI00226F4B96|nr:hypothetical protein [Niveibacterium sp. 24ML]MCX9155396.1 hypothetical protein [Niveibacterium sp. 24ML]